MKSMKFILTVLIQCFTFALYSQSQNSVWSLPKKQYVNNGQGSFVSNLPTQNPSIGYDGLPASNASNAMQDANGDLLFFIVDGEIYDKEGYMIGNLSWISSPSNEVKGTSEIAIIPQPGNCSVYYIVAAGSKDFLNTDYNRKPYLAKLDLSQYSDINASRLGKLTQCVSIQSILPANATPIEGQPQRQGNVYIAASKLRNDNSRLVFITTPYRLYRFKVDNNGFHYENDIDILSGFTGGQPSYNHWRAEMELIEKGSGYRIAFVRKGEDQNGNVIGVGVFIANLDQNGDVQSQEDQVIIEDNDPSTEIPAVHGLEFSPNGDILYITHQTDNDNPYAFEYYDFNNPTAGIQPVPGISAAQSQNYELSQIEIGRYGKLFLAHSGGLAALDDPNNPSTSTFNPSFLQFSYSSNNEGNASVYTVQTSYLLPDQIDGMDYHAIGYPSIDYIVNYTAIASETWEPGAGPNFNPWGSAYGDIYVEEQIIIPNGKSVVMRNMTFRFAPEAKIIVQQGGKLTLDNTTLTNGHVECDNSIGDYWEGVEVWGTTSMHQFPQNNPANQGMLVLKNESIIEYAHQGATNWNPDVWSEIGGVIQSTNSTFKNNRRDVAMWKYQNFVPSNPPHNTRDFSNFKNTQFITDDDFIEGHPQQGHVTMWDVHGINFTNCHFANNISGNKSISSSPHEGISSLDASFIVLPGCAITPPAGTPCPSSSLLKSSFTGLEFGVLATGAGSSKNVTVTQSEFTNNLWGVRIEGFDNSSIDRNEIVIGDGGYNGSSVSGRGIHLNNSTGYITEENIVTNTLSNSMTFGIVVINGGSNDNRLYKNTLNYLEEGTSSYGKNRNANYMRGLQFLCNDYNLNNGAILIGDNFPSGDGVRKLQGESSPTSAAGNTFQSNAVDIANFASPIVYFHNGGNTQPNITTNNVSLHKSLLRTCRSSFNRPTIVFEPNTQTLDSLEIALDSYDTTYTNLNYNYISLIDNGNTDVLQSQIVNNWSNDAWTLRGNLMQESPFLSEQALLTAASENILPNAMLLEVLLANPDATSGEYFIQKINEVTNYSMPTYMLDYVRNNWDTETVRTNLEIQLAHYRSKISSTRNFIKYFEKSKEEFTYSERLNTVLMGEGVSNKYGLIDFYIEHSEWLKADSVLNALNNDSDLEGDLGLLEDLDDYLTFRSGLGTRSIAQLDSTEVQYLETLTEKGSRASGYAENILCFFYDICYDKEMPGGESMAKMINIPTGNEPSLEELMYNITVYPNPASDFTNIQWEIYDELNNAHYKIFDLNGREVGLGIIENNKGEKVIDTRNLDNGIYIINIYNNGIMKLNSKLVVSKEN